MKTWTSRIWISYLKFVVRTHWKMMILTTMILLSNLLPIPAYAYHQEQMPLGLIVLLSIMAVSWVGMVYCWIFADAYILFKFNELDH